MTAGALSFRYFVQAQSAYDFQQNRAFLYPSNFKILDFPRNDFALIVLHVIKCWGQKTS